MGVWEERLWGPTEVSFEMMCEVPGRPAEAPTLLALGSGERPELEIDLAGWERQEECRGGAPCTGCLGEELLGSGGAEPEWEELGPFLGLCFIHLCYFSSTQRPRSPGPQCQEAQTEGAAMGEAGQAGRAAPGGAQGTGPASQPSRYQSQARAPRHRRAAFL